MRIKAPKLPLIAITLVVVVFGYVASSSGLELEPGLTIEGIKPPSKNDKTPNRQPTLIVNTPTSATGMLILVFAKALEVPISEEVPIEAGTNTYLVPITATLGDKEHSVHAILKDEDKQSAEPFKFTVDTTGPIVKEVGTDDDWKSVLVTFESPDTKFDSISTDNLIVQQKVGATLQKVPFKIPATEVNATQVRLFLDGKPWPPGAYQLSTTTVLVDELDNEAEKRDSKPFDIGFSVQEAPVLSITAVGGSGVKAPTDKSNPVWLSTVRDVELTVAGIPVGKTGTVTAVVNNRRQSPETSALNVQVDALLLDEGINSVVVIFEDATKTLVQQSRPIGIVLDTVGPLLQHVELVESPTKTGTESTLLATFASDDFGTVKPDSFVVHRGDASRTFLNARTTPDSAVVEGRTIRLGFKAPFAPGEYQLTVIGEDPNALKDAAGNNAGRQGATDETGKDQTSTFSVLAERQFGQHVEFTPYAPPKKQVIPEEGFNLGDYVETRVARLFYYRDAHRVAQIINRNIRSFNQAAVTQAERRAENSRDDADNATDERRQKERAAVRAAEQARQAEQQLADVQQTLAEVQRLENSIAADGALSEELGTRLDALGTPEPDEATANPAKAKQRAELTRQKLMLDDRIVGSEVSQKSIGDVDYLKNQVVSMQQSVANLRDTELTLRDAWNDAQAKEERAVAAQFRDEVTAAETDPDTYVAGDMHSEDPVTQCSISVIGEGLIQLRGPIKGINKIRTMINQIDSPVGQIKIGIFTVQVNGEEGDKMEKVVGDAEGNIDLSRFLVNQSLNLLRRAIQSEAAIVAEQCDLDGHYQVDRDRRYLYGFFGRDFIDELYEMNSEFMFTENKLLSLHAMDTISFNRAMFILALAKNDVRERIVTRFLESVKTELPDAEFDFRRSSELKPHRTQKHFPPWNLTHLPFKNHYHKEQVVHEAVHRNALQRYHFRNFSSFFDTGFVNSDTMNPMQREFIRLAQIFKARLIAEMEWKQRVLERGLIEDRSNDENQRAEIMRDVHSEALELSRTAYLNLLGAEANLKDARDTIEQVTLVLADLQNIVTSAEAAAQSANAALTKVRAMYSKPEYKDTDPPFLHKNAANSLTKSWIEIRDTLKMASWATSADDAYADSLVIDGTVSLEKLQFAIEQNDMGQVDDWLVPVLGFSETDLLARVATVRSDWDKIAQEVHALIGYFRSGNTDSPNAAASSAYVFNAYRRAMRAIDAAGPSDAATHLRQTLTEAYNAYGAAQGAEISIQRADSLIKRTRVDLDHRKLLNHLIDEQEDKFIELVEGTRSHVAVIDQYLKRLSIAIEDDFKVQFYDPAFVRVREAARGRSVNLSQVERTTILTNNRDFAKVDPQATMEFDLPKRQIAIKEAFDAAKALVEDTGALVNDPTFLSAFQMMGGSMQPATVKNLIPSQSQSLDQHNLGHVPPQPQSSPGSALQSLVPEPSIFKLETGTGFQIRPVMQPDGDSAVYDFDYMYTTNIREPVRADEKHIGRIKRHFVHTAVQTGNFELREISRYQVALKVSRTSKGVPLLEDIPVLGAAFRPAPSDESSLQQNIIFGQTNIYPTLFDLMGLRWAQQVVDLDHASLLESEHVIRGRQKSMRDYVFGVASKRVDEFLNVQQQTPSNYRPDFYHEQTLPSPHHPSGYVYPGGVKDPTGRGFERFDRRPPEMQEPPYDRYRHQPAHPERIGPQFEPQRIPLHAPDVVPLSHSDPTLQPAPDADIQEFQSLLLQGPQATLEKRLQPRLNEGASSTRPLPRRMPAVQSRGLAPASTLQHNSSWGMLQTAHTEPHPKTSRLDRDPGHDVDATVVRAGFEQWQHAPSTGGSRTSNLRKASRQWSSSR